VIFLLYLKVLNNKKGIMSLPLEERTFLQKNIKNLETKPTHSYKEGQIIPVLEHPGCSGLEGEVQKGDIICTKCGKNAMPDNREFEHQRLTRR
jgi:hypothetical protein